MSAVAVLAALVVVASACGGTATDAEQVLDSGNAPALGLDAADGPDSDSGDVEFGGIGPPRAVFPDVEVVEINSGQAMNVADELAGSGKATLLWFFAPH